MKPGRLPLPARTSFSVPDQRRLGTEIKYYKIDIIALFIYLFIYIIYLFFT